MWPFWLMLLVPAIGVFSPYRLRQTQGRIAWFLVGSLFVIMMGFRHQVGGDWFTYLSLFENVAILDFGEVLSLSDPGYYGLNWVVDKAGGDVHLVNFVCAAILMWGTVRFCRNQPNPWLALLVAVPYMLIVVGMGYTRQAAALGFALGGLVSLGQGRVRTFVLLVACGALFHKSAVLLIPVAALAASRHRILTGALVLAMTGLLYYLLLLDSAEQLWTDYVDAEMQSQGGVIRVAMNAVPAIIFLVLQRRLVPDLVERRLWRWVTIMAIVCIPLIDLASTAVDRVALYLIPLQLFVFARLPRLATSTGSRTILVLAISGYYTAVEYTWLNFAANSPEWVPYQFVPLWQ